jgi:hypothetical protein
MISKRIFAEPTSMNAGQIDKVQNQISKGDAIDAKDDA